MIVVAVVTPRYVFIPTQFDEQGRPVAGVLGKDWTRLNDDGEVAEADFKLFLLAKLHRAKLDLRSKCIDGVDDLLATLKRVPEADWPPEVAQFVKHWKRPRGRMRSPRAEATRRWNDPVYFAAFWAHLQTAKWRAEHGGQYKIVLPDGTRTNIRAAAIRWAVDNVNRSLAAGNFNSSRCRRVDKAKVEAFLRKGRIRPPAR